jgi:hypothetical protein
MLSCKPKACSARPFAKHRALQLKYPLSLPAHLTRRLLLPSIAGTLRPSLHFHFSSSHALNSATIATANHEVIYCLGVLVWIEQVAHAEDVNGGISGLTDGSSSPVTQAPAATTPSTVSVTDQAANKQAAPGTYGAPPGEPAPAPKKRRVSRMQELREVDVGKVLDS